MASLLPVPQVSTPLLLQLGSSSSSSSIWSLFAVNRPFLYNQKLNIQPPYSLLTTMTVHTQGRLPISSFKTHNLVPKREKTEPETDAISILNERIRRDHSKRESTRPVMDSQEADMYIQLVKEQQQRGLQKLKGDRECKEGGVFSYKVDPYTLRSGDYVVHKKVGVGRFVGIKFDVPKSSTEPIEYKDLTERETPMDRLICGDVGFGKTEVALRAIFCVVSAGKQAMVLAPTIVLAKQHFDVISERFSKYPTIKVGLLSRFQGKAEKEEYLNMIKKGDLDIIVGTHSLLGNRVVYNNLGLLVVDEEQRFGVKQKEKIASFKTSVDVLTLSATPIPRTLYLALTGFRDASLISTPPPERVPIKTRLSAFGKEKVIAAIQYELDRGGQVFYVLPRIKGLEEVMDFLKQSFPDVDIAIAHGKQYSKQLEETMEKFAQGEIKILICTNIVESGLDIQNTNTVIIQDVQQFGLAQLYQLRGRVGRADREAYAYLFYPDKSLLSDQALERLAALEDCRELGQGFQLAEKDMGIRGFGTIFGEQQTGDIGNVGIDFFFEMLFESLSKVEENRVVSVPYQSVQIDININPHLPSEYINYLENPMEIINEAEKAAEKDIWSLIQFTENLRRQYGKEPYSMEILLKKLYVRRMAADLGVSRIYASGKMVGMKTNTSKRVFKLMTESMISDVHRNSLIFEGDQIRAELFLELPQEQLLNWISVLGRTSFFTSCSH
ncbi:syntaxin-22-like [Hibiscus syriacus]|uniref:Syntaxin-22-like n=1 Tax=Hibiscus syriacus TaxID=106335 RepID=A0A6A2XQC0_HIBSY|nr:syntaxin-22-like [Hibiscus syriacus]